ncbi:MAG TPA: hypothetical protein VLE49_14550, partial [Anaerolineales bacterium]|nr:hypothetical protein [Anaerolineales bacterium]
MTSTRKFTQAVLSLTMILSMVLSLLQTQPVVAAGGPTQGPTSDSVKKEVNSETGKVSFLVPAGGRSSVSAAAWGVDVRNPVADPGMAVAKQFAPEFGVQNPEQDLTVMETSQQQDGRVTVRYQQTYQGIPVFGGELMVNTNQNGDLYSMNGEVSQGLSIDTQPAITAEQAIEIAKQSMVKWHGGKPADYQQTQPSLWIYDEQLVRPSDLPIKRP